jgi:hypothetical protein
MTFTQVSAGGWHGCGRKTDGTVTCWGSNSSGESAAPAGTFSQVGVGHSHSCALQADGQITCWGKSASGESNPPVIDFTATKGHDTGGPTAPGRPFTWTIMISNAGGTEATFGAGETIFADNLPDSDIAYGPVTLVNVSTVACADRVSCAIDGSSNLTCSASGGSVYIGRGGSFDVQFSANPSGGGMFNNPRPAGICRVDPDSLVTESDETNNDCSDGVPVVYLDISRAGDDLQLDWADVAADGYGLWRDLHNPYAMPGLDCCGSYNCAVMGGTSYVHSGAAGDGNNHFYVVEAASDTGTIFSTSNRVGQFVFGLVPGEPDPG